ncbi:TetR family transcriptional regulator [Aquihabitans sp. McL0605]|uniref:TetR family transcriptional regulator n=1 Tax=Aquihabitans sp. McL0605 TaxID=3415671 RepID=UPI003CFA3666
MDPDTRRGLIADAAESLLAEHDPLLVTFDQVATAAGVSRALVHTYLGDRRGLIDAVQVQIVGRLDTWVGHGLRRATTPRARLRAVVQGVFAFVEAEQDAWGVLGASGGFDHPALHGVRGRWAAQLAGEGADDDLRGQIVVGAVLGGVGSWVNRGVDPDRVEAALAPLLVDPAL